MVRPRKPGETDAEYFERMGQSSKPATSAAAAVWQLRRDPNESDEDYALRCIAFGCDADGCRTLPDRSR
jgi:hypothetical protein